MERNSKWRYFSAWVFLLLVVGVFLIIDMRRPSVGQSANALPMIAGMLVIAFFVYLSLGFVCCLVFNEKGALISLIFLACTPFFFYLYDSYDMSIKARADDILNKRIAKIRALADQHDAVTLKEELTSNDIPPPFLAEVLNVRSNEYGYYDEREVTTSQFLFFAEVASRLNVSFAAKKAILGNVFNGLISRGDKGFEGVEKWISLWHGIHEHGKSPAVVQIEAYDICTEYPQMPKISKVGERACGSMQYGGVIFGLATHHWKDRFIEVWLKGGLLMSPEQLSRSLEDIRLSSTMEQVVREGVDWSSVENSDDSAYIADRIRRFDEHLALRICEEIRKNKDAGKDDRVLVFGDAICAAS